MHLYNENRYMYRSHIYLKMYFHVEIYGISLWKLMIHDKEVFTEVLSLLYLIKNCRGSKRSNKILFIICYSVCKYENTYCKLLDCNSEKVKLFNDSRNI